MPETQILQVFIINVVYFNFTFGTYEIYRLGIKIWINYCFHSD